MRDPFHAPLHPRVAAHIEQARREREERARPLPLFDAPTTTTPEAHMRTPHAPHAHDARRPYPPVRSRSGRSPLSPRPRAVEGGQGRAAEQLLDEGRDALVILATCGVALVLLVVGAMVLS